MNFSDRMCKTKIDNKNVNYKQNNKNKQLFN